MNIHCESAYHLMRRVFNTVPHVHTSWRVDPIAIAFIFGLRPLDEIEATEARDPIQAVLEDMLGSAFESRVLGAFARGFVRLARALAPLLEASERLREDPRTRTLLAPDLQPARR